MSALTELKKLLNQKNRKTLPIEKIAPLIEEVEKMYIQTGKKLSKEEEMNKALRSVNGQLAIQLGLKIMPDSEIKKLFEQNKARKAVKYEKQPKQIR